MEEQTISERIIGILRETFATTKDLSQTLDISENILRVTVNRMGKCGVIKHTGRFIKRYKVYRLVKPEELILGKECEKYREILMKMLLYLAKEGIKVSTITPEESKIIRELFKDHYSETDDKRK